MISLEVDKSGLLINYVEIHSVVSQLFKYYSGASLCSSSKVGLIDKILAATQMEDCKPNNLPVNGPLGSDPNGR